MKKILMMFVAAACVLSSCNKDFLKSYYSNSLSVEKVNYSIEIHQVDEDFYDCTIFNSDDEVSVKYTFVYDEKKSIRLDFEEIKSAVDSIINQDTNIERVFTHEFRYLNNDEPAIATAHVFVNAGQVVVRFSMGDKEFEVPYRFIVGAINSLKPAE